MPGLPSGDHRTRFSLAAFPELIRGVMASGLAPPSPIIKTHSWLNFPSPTARKAAKPSPRSHHPTVLVFGTRQTQVLILALPRGRTSILEVEAAPQTYPSGARR